MLSLLLNPWSNKSHVFWVQVWTRLVNSQLCWLIKTIWLVRSMISRPPSSSKWKRFFASTLLSVMFQWPMINSSKTWTCQSTFWSLSSRRTGKTSNPWPSSPPWENHNVSTKYLVTIIKYWYIGIKRVLCYLQFRRGRNECSSLWWPGCPWTCSSQSAQGKLQSYLGRFTWVFPSSGPGGRDFVSDENAAAHLNILACGKTLDEQYNILFALVVTLDFRIKVGRTVRRK